MGITERLAVSALAVLALLGLWLAPWAALNREIGADSALLLLPNRIVDFTGDTEPLAVAGQGATLVLSLAALLAIAAGGMLAARRRYLVWLVAALALIAATAYGLSQFRDAIEGARIAAFVAEVEEDLADPSERMDVPALESVVAQAQTRPLAESLAAAREAGVRVRRLPYDNSGMALSAFVNLAVGVLALLFGLRLSPRLSKQIDRLLAGVAVPAASILLALVAAAVVVLVLQPTALGRGAEVGGWFPFVVGRLDTVWYTYHTLFSGSLATFPGFLEALKFATPLIFTGLAVAFGFQAGLFNIGAPGQMILGAVFAMVAGLYLPGPRLLVLPAAVLASALGGGLWGALPGWLKARFGANEVINTILLNYIAASLLLFLLSANQTFSAPALRIIMAIAGFAVLAIVLSIIPVARRFFSRSPRLTFAVGGLFLLVILVVVGLPQPGDTPVTLHLPFKAPGSELKSLPLNETARLQQLPALLGITRPGANAVAVNYGLLLAPLTALLALVLAPKVSARLRGWWQRAAAALGVGVVVYGLAALTGLTARETVIPPTNLNTSFVLAILTAVLMYYLLWRTKWGYELRAVGVAPKAAEYGGANIARNVIVAMTISGAFAGLTATHYVLGGALEGYTLRQSLPTNDGFDGIAVALLGGNTPLGVVLSAFLFGVLKNGGSAIDITFSELTRDVVGIILALVVLFIAARGFLPEWLTDPVRRRAQAFERLEPEAVQPLDAPGKPVRTSEEVREKTSD